LGAILFCFVLVCFVQVVFVEVSSGPCNVILMIFVLSLKYHGQSVSLYRSINDDQYQAKKPSSQRPISPNDNDLQHQYLMSPITTPSVTNAIITATNTDNPSQ
jgi:hypothetical protein